MNGQMKHELQMERRQDTALASVFTLAVKAQMWRMLTALK
jgi:hypothetical protein